MLILLRRPEVLSFDVLRQYPRRTMEFTRALRMYLRIIKELASVRLPHIKKRFQASAVQSFDFLTVFYLEAVSNWKNGQNSHADADEIILLIKCLRYLLINGFDYPHRNQAVLPFWAQADLYTFGEWPELSEFDPSSPTDPRYKLYEQLEKVHLEVAKAHPSAFVLLPNFDQLINQHWGLSVAQAGEHWKMSTVKSLQEVNDDHIPPENHSVIRLGVRSLLLLRQCARMALSPAHTFTSHIAEDRAERDQVVNFLTSTLFTAEFVIPIAKFLVDHFFVLRKDDLRDWEEAPDEWDEKLYGEANNWGDGSLPGCSEKLFLDLVINFKAVLIPQLVGVFNEIVRKYHHLHIPIVADCFRFPKSEHLLERLWTVGHWSGCECPLRSSGLQPIPRASPPT
jgi:hypothetical protein